MSAHDLAKMFSFNGEEDRLIEIMRLNSLLVPNANELKASAASTGIPMLYHRHSVPWQKTEEIIESLLAAIGDVPEDVIHAISVLSLGQHLGAMEERVVLELTQELQSPALEGKEKILVKCCEALGFIGSSLAIEPLKDLEENTGIREVELAAARALARLGVGSQKKKETEEDS